MVMKTPFAIITGATSGLGKAYAQTLAKMHWNVLLTGRRVDKLMQIKTQLEEKHHIEVQTSVTDFNNETQFSSFLKTVDQLTQVDLLVNNAGYGNRNGFFNHNYQNQAQMLNVLVSASTRIIHKVVPKMLKQNAGAIINVASLSAFIPAPLNYFYCSSKAFMVSFSECLHIDLMHTHIKVQALCPGFIRTEFHSRMGLSEHENSLKEKLLWMNPEDVVQYSLKSLSKHSVICIPGVFNRLIYRTIKFIPKSLSYWLVDHQSPEHHASAELCTT